jgi:hypothetical protein
MADFLAHPQPRTMTFRPGGAHPTAYLRVYLLAEMLRRMGFTEVATRLLRVWQALYRPQQGHRIPAPLMSSAPRVIPDVVDEIAFQTRRNLAQRALADIIPFTRDDEAAIRQGAIRLGAGREADLPPRHLVSAAHYALEQGRIAPQRLASCVTGQLTAHLRRERAPAARPLRLAA